MMETAEPYCQLLSTDGLHSPIDLKNESPLLIGRGSLTKIVSKKCSRQQVLLTANFKSQEVCLKVIGKNSSRVGDQVLKKGDEYILGTGGRFELIRGYNYCIFFGKRLPCHTQMSVSESLPVIGAIKRGKNRCSVEGETSVKRIKLMDETLSGDVSISRKESRKTLESFFRAKPSASEQTKVECCECGTLLVLRYGPQCPSEKIAAFDLDSTLIETSSGRKFATGPKDWKLMVNVQEKIELIQKSGYRIIIFTNQGGLSRGKPTQADFKEKIQAIAAKVDLPVLVMVSSGRDIYRKPCTGMWDYVVQNENGGIKPNLSYCFFVGDAAGRIDGWKQGRKKDFSCTDRKFASNLGIPFKTPEEYFLGYPRCSKFSWGEFDPRKINLEKCCPQIDPPDAVLVSVGPEVVVFVGFPASGKTTFYETVMKSNGYVHVNRDILGSWQKCVSLCEKELLGGRRVVVDNTNPDAESRLRYISCAKKHDVPVKCFQFMTTLAQAKHNNKFRELTTKDNRYNKVTDIAYNVYKSRYVEPMLKEGFNEIIKITIYPKITNEFVTLFTQFLQ